MEKNMSSNKKNNFLGDQHLKKGMEIQNNKIMPRFEKRNSRRFRKEDEWEQEYFIIYNSYVLEDQDPEAYSD